MKRAIVGVGFFGLALHCGDDATSVVNGAPADGGIHLDAGQADSTSAHDAAGDTGSEPGCESGASCTTNPGAPCVQGRIVCNGATPTCADGPSAADGTSCSSGLCTAGACLGPTEIAGDTNLSTQSITAGRVCNAEAPAFSVSQLTANTATLAAAPTDDCLAAGDEVLVIDLQGTSAGTANVGNWELLRIASISGTTITFTTAKTRSYGSIAGSDTGIATEQKVGLFRVPQFGNLVIHGSDAGPGARLSANGWDGTVGGVVALRAAKLTVDGTISAAGLGYRPGRWSSDDGDCNDNVLTEAGESFTGPAVAQIVNNGGAPGGISALTGVSYNGNTPMNASAGHSAAGVEGNNGRGRIVGDAGAAYGLPDAGTLTMGSGASGNVTCDLNGTNGGALLAAQASTAGGIVVLLVGQLDVGGSGTITASAKPDARDVSASAGYVYIKGTTLNVGTGQVTAVGGTAVSGSSSGGPTVKSSDGYIVLDAPTKTGTTTPAAN